MPVRETPLPGEPECPDEIKAWIREDIRSGAPGPLVIYGGTRTLRAKALEAASDAIRADHPAARVLLESAQEFAERHRKSLAARRYSAFLDRYCTRDAVLIAEIDALLDDEDLLEDFFLTMRAVLDQGRQVILICSRYPDQFWPSSRTHPQAWALLGGGSYIPLPDEPPGPEQIEWLIAFNERLRLLEIDIVTDGWRCTNDLSAPPKGCRDLLESFHLEACVAYWLRRDEPDYNRIRRTVRHAGSCPSGRFDPAYRIDGSILTQRWYGLDEHTQLADGLDHNDCPLAAYRAIPNHSYLLHELYDHAYGPKAQTLTLAEMPRIGGIEVRFLAMMDWQVDLAPIPHTPDPLSPDDPLAKYWLTEFDSRMSRLETEIAAEAGRIEQFLKRRLDDPSDWTSGYSINAIVTYYGREDELAGSDEMEELAIRRCAIGHGRFGVIAESDGLPLEDVLRIGSVYVELNAETWTNILPST